MENQSPGIIAAFWGVVGITIAALIRWVVIRLVVPRDAVLKKYLDDMKKDIDALKAVQDMMAGKQERHGAEIAFIRGILDPRHDGR